MFELKHVCVKLVYVLKNAAAETNVNIETFITIFLLTSYHFKKNSKQLIFITFKAIPRLQQMNHRATTHRFIVFQTR